MSDKIINHNNIFRQMLNDLKDIIDKRVNKNYFSVFKEINLLLKIAPKVIKKNPHEIDTTKFKKILLINTCLIGDFIVSIPAINYFIQKHSNSKIDIVVSPMIEKLAKRINGINKVYIAKSIYNRKIERGFKKKEITNNYDYVVTLRMSKDAYQILKNIKYKYIRTHLKPFIELGFYLATKKNIKKEEIKQMRQMAFEVFGYKNVDTKEIDYKKVFNFKLKDYENIERFNFLDNKKKKIVVIHTGSGWYPTLWNNDNWANLIKKINKIADFIFVFIGKSNTDKEIKAYEYILSKLNNGKIETVSLINKLDILDTTLLLSKCDFFIGIDSGPRHLAHLVDTPSISLLGPGKKIFEPLNDKAIIIDKSICKSCSYICYRKVRCLERIKVNDVLKAFYSLGKK